MDAYEDGKRAGRADAMLGIRSEYAWHTCLDSSNLYSVAYGQGYRDGRNEKRRPAR
jgi:hypothetical protein